MINAPEKIWLWGDGGRTLVSKPHEPYPADAQGYLHTDLHLALVAAAYEAGADVARKPYLPFDVGGDYIMDTTQGGLTAEAIRALTPADAQAALEKVKREARNEARREAAKRIDAFLGVTRIGVPDTLRVALLPDECAMYLRDEILALMEDTDDE